VRFDPPSRFTPFLSKRLYILRLYKLVEIPSVNSDEEDQDEHEVTDADSKDEDQDERRMVEEADGDDEGSASEPGDESSSSDSDDDSSESDSDPDKGKHNKKRQARQALEGSPPAKRRKSKPASPQRTAVGPRKRIVRQHQPIPRPEVYTTVWAANSAACDLQMDIMDEQTLPRQAEQESNAARLRMKLLELVEKEGEERFWHNEFPVGLAGARMEIAVESVGVCGPRNV
jgi:hypothetical protein